MNYKKEFPNIKVDVVITTPNTDEKIKLGFYNALKDYCERFGVKPLDKKFRVSICLIEYPDPYDYDFQNGVANGLTIFEPESNRIIIQTRDPQLNEWEDNFYVVQQTLETLFHEFVHAFQHITDRKGLNIKVKHDKTSDRESFLFDPAEMEARLLELPYSVLFGYDFTK